MKGILINANKDLTSAGKSKRIYINNTKRFINR